MSNHWIAVFLLAEGIVCGVIAWVMFLKKRAQISRWQRTWGEVVEVKEHKGSDTTTRHPVIRYKTARGADATFESRYGSSNWDVKPGDRLEILADPERPGEAVVAQVMALWALPLVLGIAALASLIGAPLVYVFLK